MRKQNTRMTEGEFLSYLSDYKSEILKMLKEDDMQVEQTKAVEQAKAREQELLEIRKKEERARAEVKQEPLRPPLSVRKMADFKREQKEERNAIILQLFESGETAETIAFEVECSKATVLTVLKEQGIEVEIAFKIRKQQQRGLSQQQIAKKLGLSNYKVRKYWI